MSNYSAKQHGTDRRLDGGRDHRLDSNKGGSNKYDRDMPYNSRNNDSDDDYEQDYKQSYRKNQNRSRSYRRQDSSDDVHPTTGSNQFVKKMSDGSEKRLKYHPDEDSEEDDQQGYRSSKKNYRRNQDGSIDKRQVRDRGNYNDDDDYEQDHRSSKKGLRKNMDGTVDRRQFNGENLQGGTALRRPNNTTSRNDYDEEDSEDDDDNNYQQRSRGSKKGLRHNQDGTVDKRQFNGKNGYNKNDPDMNYNDAEDSDDYDDDDDNNYQQQKNYRSNKKQGTRRNQDGSVDKRQFNGKNGYNKNDPDMNYNDAEDSDDYDDDNDNNYQQRSKGSKQGGLRKNMDGTVDRRQFNGENLQGGTALRRPSNTTGRQGRNDRSRDYERSQERRRNRNY